MCDKKGKRITIPEDQLLLRHLLEAWLDPNTGEPTSQGFRPMRAEDENCLSVDQLAMTTVVEAFRLCSAQPPEGFGNNVKSTWGISLAELTTLALEAWKDPVSPTGGMPANPAHTVIGFEHLGNNDQTRVARKLKAKAIARGRQYPGAAKPTPTQAV